MDLAQRILKDYTRGLFIDMNVGDQNAVTSQYGPVGSLRHPVFFFNTAKTCR
jgi:hypothetical protein